MSDLKITAALSDAEVLRELGERIRAARLRVNLTMDDAAKTAGIHRNTWAKAEDGKDPRLLTVIRILRTLDRLEALEGFLPEPQLSPIEIARAQAKKRRPQRASKKR